MLSKGIERDQWHEKGSAATSILNGMLPLMMGSLYRAAVGIIVWCYEEVRICKYCFYK